MGKKMKFWTMALAFLTMGCQSCNDSDSPEVPTPDEKTEEGIHTYKAPLYWSVYEYCWLLERQGVAESDMDLSEAEWDKIIDWVARDLKPYGYNMICTDGFIPMIADDASGYMTRYGSMPLKKLVEKCRAKGLEVGVYDNPLWIHGADDTPVQGAAGVTFGDLKYRQGDAVEHPADNDWWFSWVVASHDGAQEYIDGFFKHFSDLGVHYIRMDFLSWYEDGTDRGFGRVGKGYGRDNYERALKYICESATKYGVFTSLVMPHLYKNAELESQYGNMVRIVADTAAGGWEHFSDNDRRKSYGTWPNCMNMFDGFVYWSKVTGRGKVIPDGDFIRLNTFKTDAEKESVISLQLLAGGPVTVADQYHSIGDNLRFYQNREMLELNADRFVGQPLSGSLLDGKNQTWYGQMTNGDWIVGLFNRESTSQTRSVRFSDLGITGKWKVRDLWKHADEGEADGLDVTLEAHGCKVVRLSK